MEKTHGSAVGVHFGALESGLDLESFFALGEVFEAV
jgi:hypothetical protein